MLSIPFACPHCHRQLIQKNSDELFCEDDALHFHRINGIWRFLLPERAPALEKFMVEYETVRRAEGRGSQEAAYYLGLPYQDLSGTMSADWGIRAASFDMFLHKVLLPWEGASHCLRIFDMGAGNGWLSNRLAVRGHAVTSVDLMINDFDGLGCRRFYEPDFTSVQAEFDQLPFEDGGVDLIVFNASLHYSTNYPKTLRESLRVLNGSGKLVVLDSPVYRDGGSGALMVREREGQFSKRFGFPSNALPSENYLTYARLDELAVTFGLKWQFCTPFYGWRWSLSPILSKLRGSREPARFHVIIGSRA